MKKLAIGMVLAITAIATVIGAKPRSNTVPRMYIFGFAASFNDTIVHFTDIQALNNAWIDCKNKFLSEREAYSYQLRDFLAQPQMPHRTCIVVYNQDSAKLQKRYQKMRRLYETGRDGRPHYDVRMAVGFHFTTIDMSPYFDTTPSNDNP